MGSHTKVEVQESSDNEGLSEQLDYTRLILRLMAEQGVGSRGLALKTGIGKSRMHSIVHTDAGKRMPMTLDEFQIILRALEMNVIQAVVSVEAIRDQRLLDSERYTAVIVMLCKMFAELPVPLIEAIDKIDGIDGSEVRPEWAGPLRNAVIKRLVYEIGKVAERRSSLDEDDLSIMS